MNARCSHEDITVAMVAWRGVELIPDGRGLNKVRGTTEEGLSMGVKGAETIYHRTMPTVVFIGVEFFLVVE